MATWKDELVLQTGTTSSVLWKRFDFVTSDLWQQTTHYKICLKGDANKSWSTVSLFQHLQTRTVE